MPLRIDALNGNILSMGAVEETAHAVHHILRTEEHRGLSAIAVQVIEKDICRGRECTLSSYGCESSCSKKAKLTADHISVLLPKEVIANRPCMINTNS